MFVTIEGKCNEAEKTVVSTTTDFDVLNGFFESVVHTKTTYKTPVHNYKDFSLLWCIVPQQNAKKVRFVLFNLQKQQALCLFEHKICKNITINRLNEQIFVILCTDINFEIFVCKVQKSSTMHQCIVLKNLRQMGMLKQRYIVVNNVKNQVHSIELFDTQTMQKTVLFCSKQQICFKYLNNTLKVFDNQNTLLFETKI